MGAGLSGGDRQAARPGWSAPARAALDDYRNGVYSIPLPLASKGPRCQGWQHLRLAPGQLPGAFPPRANRGRLLGIAPPDGAPGGYVVCVDLDTPQAVALAADWLPATGEIGGRADAPTTHWFYASIPPPPTTRYSDPDGTRLLELLSTGTQVLVPPSLHPSGQPYAWTACGNRAQLGVDVLQAACGRLAVATLLARRWPDPGARQQAALALAGAFLAADWSEEATQRLLAAVARAAGDEELGKRTRTVAGTVGRRQQGGPACGWPTLARIFGDAVVDRLRDWLGLRARALDLRGAPAAAPLTCRPTVSAPPPRPLDAAAYWGLAGDLVRTLAPHTEADPAALLFQFLTAFGNAAGPQPSFAVEATRHGANLFCVLVGDSSKARKGTSWQHILRLFRLAAQQSRDPGVALDPWLRESIKDGLSSGEGLIWHVRDPVREWQAGRHGGGHEVVVDGGVKDKRLLIQASELISSIRCMSRHGNTLSAVLRCAWDCGELRILTRHQPVTASGAHISLVGHITTAELRRGLADVEVANGFANRFLWVFVERSRLLPEGGALNEDALLPLAQRLAQALHHAWRCRLLARDEGAAGRWRSVYPELSAARPGLSGSITSRAEAQVVRLSLIYALLDLAPAIRRCHLEAALEVWRYAGESVRFIFGEATGDPIADALLQALRGAPQGLTTTQLYDLFGRHKDKQSLDRALKTLHNARLIQPQQQPTAGRPRQVWLATDAGPLSQDPSFAADSQP